MDIEGGEIAALHGAEKALQQTDRIVVEAFHHVDDEPTAPKVVEILTAYGFEAIRSDDNWVFARR